MRVWILALVLAGCTAPAPDAIEPDQQMLAHLETTATFPELRLETDHGTIRAILYTDWLPGTTQHVGGLARAGFYDGITFHRVIDDFVIQGGDPTGTGQGGSGPLGTPDPVPLEIHAGLDFGSGAIGLARWTDDTGDSQFFITEKPALHLSRPSGATGAVFGAYSLFGQVFDGMDVVRAIAAVETLPDDRPVEAVVVQTASLLPPPTGADLFGLVLDVVDLGQSRMLEVPRYMVADHPATLRFTAKQAPCQAEPLDLEDAGSWRPVPADACTFETEVVFQQAGTYVIAGHEWTVLPWHEAYLPFMGSGDTL